MPSPESKKVSALIIFTKGNFLVTDIIEAIPNIAKISGSKKYPSPNMYLNPANTFSPTHTHSKTPQPNPGKRPPTTA
jgi:hypothetical protein